MEKRLQLERQVWPGVFTSLGFSSGSDGQQSASNAGDLGSVPGSGRSSKEGNCYPLQYNSMDRGTWWAIVHVVAKSQT